MSFERLTDEGPKGREATFAAGETHQPLGVAFVRSTNPKANCRLERTTYETPAPSALAAARVWIDDAFSADTVDEIVARLRGRPEPEASATADTLDEVVIGRRESKREVQDLLIEAMKRRGI